MKNTIALLSFLLLICSCATEKLSCNKNIDKWAKENVIYYQNSSRDELVSLPWSAQQALFNGMSSEKKVELWLIKKDYLLNSSSFSPEEKKEIINLFDHLKPEVYSNKKANAEYHRFTENWEARMRTDFNWDDEILFFAVCTWMTRDEFIASTGYDDKIVTKGNGDDTNNCNCRYTIYCEGRIHGEQCDHGANCDEVGGCGITGTSSCNGICR